MNHQNLLVELFVEELPPKALQKLGDAFAGVLLEQLQADQPRHALAAYGLGRLYTAMEQWDEAIRQFERARALDGAEQLPLDHRIGIALQAKGEKAQARAAYERYLQNRRASPNNVEDCKRRLAELSAAL